VQVRKVILGLSDAFQNNKSWRFIDGNFEFDKEVDPLSQNFPEKYEISNLSADMKADFIGVKIADVNGTAKVGGFQSGQVETRSKQRLDISGRASINQIDFLTSFDKSLRGFQMTITFDNSSMKVTGLRSSVLELDANSYHINNEKGFVTLSWHNSKVLDFRDNEVLFSLVAEGQLDEETIEISSSFTRAEAYDEDFRIMEIDYRPYSMLVKNILHQNEPNPWISSTTIKFDLAEENDIQIIFRDAQGKLLKQIDMDGMKGTNIIEVNADELNATGMLFYEMIVGEERISRKMILLD